MDKAVVSQEQLQAARDYADALIAKGSLQKRANQIARKHGFHRATIIVLGDEDKVVSHVRYGYRKDTTGEYVSSAYRAHFGWKNTHYQPAETTVMVRVVSA